MLKIEEFRGYKYVEIGGGYSWAPEGYYSNSTPEQLGFSGEGIEGIYARRAISEDGGETICVAVYIEGWLAIETDVFDPIDTRDYIPYSCAVFGATESDAHAAYDNWMESLS